MEKARKKEIFFWSLLMFILQTGQVLAASPVAIEDSYSIEMNETLALFGESVLDNDTDTDVDALTAELVTTTVEGVLTFETDGTFVYEPEFFFAGVDTFTYKAYDGANYSNTVTVSITVTDPSADITPPPVPENLEASYTAGTYIIIDWDRSVDVDTETQGYRLYKEVSDSFVQIADIDDGISYLDTGLSVSTLYKYKVSAYDEEGNESALSDSISVNTLGSDSYDLVFYTGKPEISTSGGTLNNTTITGRAQKFTLSENKKIDEVEMYLVNNTGGAKNLSIVIYEDGSQTPDTASEVFSTTLSFTPDSSNEVSWRKVQGLDWQLVSGDYWVALEYRDSNDFSGYVPIVGTISFSGAYEEYGSYEESSSAIGVKIFGSAYSSGGGGGGGGSSSSDGEQLTLEGVLKIFLIFGLITQEQYNIFLILF